MRFLSFETDNQIHELIVWNEAMGEHTTFAFTTARLHQWLTTNNSHLQITDPIMSLELIDEQTLEIMAADEDGLLWINHLYADLDCLIEI